MAPGEGGSRLKLKPAKCELLQTKVGYLGNMVSQGRVSTDPVKIKAVAQWPAPTDLKELQAFLGTVEYYRQHTEFCNSSQATDPTYRE